MAIPLLNYAPTTQNARVTGYEIPGDEQPKIYSAENLLSSGEMKDLIEAAYRQIFFHAFKRDREPFLESQLRNGQLTVRDFVRGLLLSNTYRRSFYNLNNNYRFVAQTVERVLGRKSHGQQEEIAWSIVIATKGLEGFVDALLESPEYLDSFGYDILPYQRRRVLPGRERASSRPTSSCLAMMPTIATSWVSPRWFGMVRSKRYPSVVLLHRATPATISTWLVPSP